MSETINDSTFSSPSVPTEISGGSKRRISPAVLIAPLAVATTVWGASSAAFTDTTDNGPDTFAAANVVLTDNDNGGLLFAATDLVPGNTIDNCIRISYEGSTFELNPVKLYGELPTNVDGFAGNLNLKVEMAAVADATTAFDGSCDIGAETFGTVYDGTLSGFASAHIAYDTGAGTTAGWTPTADKPDAVYRFTVEVDAATPDTAQGDSASALFTWEVQSA